MTRRSSVVGGLAAVVREDQGVVWRDVLDTHDDPWTRLSLAHHFLVPYPCGRGGGRSLATEFVVNSRAPAARGAGDRAVLGIQLARADNRRRVTHLQRHCL